MRFILFISVLFIMACSSVNKKGEALTVLSWNVEALFDGNDDGVEYDEFRAKNGWNDEKYRARLTVISKALEKAAGHYPDVAVFIELENEKVLDDIAAENQKAAYTGGFFSKRPREALGTGVLSRYPINKAVTHSYSADGETIPRPISEIWVEANGSEFVLLVCHWKSKLGKPEQTRKRRLDTARLVKRLTLDIMEENSEIPVLLAGDFNQTIDEFLDDDYPLIVTRQKDAFYGGPEYYSPWGTELEGGSYFYRGEWESIDHFFLSSAFFNGKGWSFDSVYLLKDSPWTGADGTPVPYNAKTGTGLSDHLPLLLRLKLIKGLA